MLRPMEVSNIGENSKYINRHPFSDFFTMIFHNLLQTLIRIHYRIEYKLKTSIYLYIKRPTAQYITKALSIFVPSFCYLKLAEELLLIKIWDLYIMAHNAFNPEQSWNNIMEFVLMLCAWHEETALPLGMINTLENIYYFLCAENTYSWCILNW